MTKPKSRLEREKEAAAALRASSGSDPFRRSISNVKSKVLTQTDRSDNTVVACTQSIHKSPCPPQVRFCLWLNYAST